MVHIEFLKLKHIQVILFSEFLNGFKDKAATRGAGNSGSDMTGSLGSLWTWMCIRT